MAVLHATPRAAAIRLTDRWLTTKASSAHRNTPPDRQERGYAALVKSWRQNPAQTGGSQKVEPAVTIELVGSQGSAQPCRRVHVNHVNGVGLLGGAALTALAPLAHRRGAALQPAARRPFVNGLLGGRGQGQQPVDPFAPAPRGLPDHSERHELLVVPNLKIRTKGA